MQKQRKVSLAHSAPLVISGAVLQAFFHGEQAQADALKVAGYEKTRMGYLLETMFTRTEKGYTEKVDSKQVKDATAEYVKSIATDAGWKGGKGSGKRPAAVKSALNRAGDIKALYGAIRFTGFNPEASGYHDATTAARAKLADAGIKWEGGKVPDAEDRKAQKIAATAVATVGALEAEVRDFAREHGRVPTDAEMQEMAGKASNLYAAQSAWMGACNLVSKMGSTFAEQVAALVPQAINAVDSAKEDLGDQFGKDTKATREALEGAMPKAKAK